MKFSCTVKVLDTEPLDFGAVATVEFVQPSVGIDISPEGPIKINYTADSAEMFKPGNELTLTISNE
jgi:hypothetical protein